ncbi:helix-turn-helix domain-containing protein [Halorubrum sp. CBA1125]|nr:helix-turn-helix domain-containing protein [Halorubrum sp. CBA1125]
MSQTGPKTVAATVNSFQILETLIAADGPMGVTELADVVGLSKGVVYNHLGTLSELGYVRKEDQKYRPSLRLLSLGSRVRTGYEIFDAVRPHLENLTRTTGEVATLFVEEDGQGVCVYQTAGSESWSPEYVSGDALPLHVTAPGKAILATLSDERVTEIVSRHGLESVTDQTVSDTDALFSTLQRIREDDVAFAREEHFAGIVGVGTAVGLGERAPAAAIGICGPLDRLHGRYLKEDVTGQVISTAKSIGVDLTT